MLTRRVMTRRERRSRKGRRAFLLLRLGLMAAMCSSVLVWMCSLKSFSTSWLSGETMQRSTASSMYVS
jgi:hypothetical protein